MNVFVSAELQYSNGEASGLPGLFWKLYLLQEPGMPYNLVSLFFVALALTRADAADLSPRPAQSAELRITVVFNNVAYQPGLETGWGFSCLIEGAGKTILFDTGGDGAVLLGNMRRLGLNPKAVEAIVLSHIHGDHTAGLEAFLRENREVRVFLPRVFPPAFKEKVRRWGAQVVETKKPHRLCEGAWTTEVLNEGIPEQAISVTTPRGPVVITGCAHPGVVRLVEAAKRHAGMPVHAVLGGFHMGGASPSTIDATAEGLRKAGVRHVAPCHCSGSTTRELMKKAFGNAYLPSGAGARLVFEDQKQEKKP
jgi:7,8-dihydropterin-6-yl-methyl-4-(beta-D-ribofuranosyl)aminobenzene 5'-phosphate synthase